MSGSKFASGDPCFAKVKGYIPFPARILRRSEKVKKEKFSVLFYGTGETADVERAKLWSVSPESIKRFVTASSLARKYFKPGYEEMKVWHGLCEQGTPSEKRVSDVSEESYKSVPIPDENNVACDTPPVDDDDEFDFEFNYIRRPIKKTQIDINPGVDAEPESSKSELVLSESVQKEFEQELLEKFGEVLEAQDDKVDEVVKETDVGGEDEQVLEAMGDELGVDGKTGGDYFEAAKKKPRAGTTKSKKIAPKGKRNQTAPKSKNKKTAPKKKGKSLREDEMGLNDAFAEKIVFQDDETFHCKSCPNFVTSVRLLARTHAQSCGSLKKQAGRKAKKISCLECGAVCDGKKGIKKHFKVSHLNLISSYVCSKCFKTFKSRKNYANHLKIHDARTAVKYPHCPKTFLFDSYKRRHIKRSQRNALKNPGHISAETAARNDDLETEINLEIEVNLVEAKVGQEHSWQMNVTFPASDIANRCSYGSFFNTLGLYSKEEWDDWVQISHYLSIPLSAEGLRDDFEIAFSKDGNGKEEIICVGSSSLQALFGGGEDDDGATVPHIVEPSAVAVISQSDDAVDDILGEGASDQDAMQKSGLVKCPHCEEEGFKDAWFLQRHIRRMHLVPIKCEICQTVFIDKYRYGDHSKHCFYFCPKEGCSFQDKRKSRLAGHLRKHDREW